MQAQSQTKPPLNVKRAQIISSYTCPRCRQYARASHCPRCGWSPNSTMAARPADAEHEDRIIAC